MDAMTHEEKVIIYTMGILRDSRKLGLNGGTFELGDDGIAAYKKLKRENFKPSYKEIETAFVLLTSPPPECLMELNTHQKEKVTLKNFHMWIIKKFKIFINILFHKNEVAEK